MPQSMQKRRRATHIRTRRRCHISCWPYMTPLKRSDGSGSGKISHELHRVATPSGESQPWKCLAKLLVLLVCLQFLERLAHKGEVPHFVQRSLFIAQSFKETFHLGVSHLPILSDGLEFEVIGTRRNLGCLLDPMQQHSGRFLAIFVDETVGLEQRSQAALDHLWVFLEQPIRCNHP